MLASHVILVQPRVDPYSIACRLPDLYAASRGVEVSPALSAGLNRPLGSPPDLRPPSRRNSAQLGNLGSSLGSPPVGPQEERKSSAGELQGSPTHAKVRAANLWQCGVEMLWGSAHSCDESFHDLTTWACLPTHATLGAHEFQEPVSVCSSPVQEGPQNGHRTPTPARQAIKGEEETDDIHPASALLFLKSSEPQGRHSRPQTASR